MNNVKLIDRFQELAMAEKWFEIQDELFADDVESIEPKDSPWLADARGKQAVREKAMAWVNRITAVHSTSTTAPIVAENHFVVGRKMDLTVQDLGRVQMDQLMLYEIRDGKIVKEQFFYDVPGGGV
jgi:ketosteroid isomerase-like protein